MHWDIFLVAAVAGTIVTLLRRLSPASSNGIGRKISWRRSVIIFIVFAIASFIFGLRSVFSFAVGCIAGSLGFFLLMFAIPGLAIFILCRESRKRGALIKTP